MEHKSVDEIIIAVRDKCRDQFIELGGPDLAPVTYHIAPNGVITIVPALVPRSQKHLFWKRVRELSHKQPTAAVLMITGAHFKADAGVLRDGHLDVPPETREALLAILERKDGRKQCWVAIVHRVDYYSYKSVMIDEWQVADGMHFERMFESN